MALAHHNLANALSDKGDLDGALTGRRRAIELDPNFADFHFSLGKAFDEEQHDLEGALVEYNKAIKLDPKHAKAINGVGKVLFARGDLEGALARFRKAVELDPKLPQPQNNVGAVLAMRGEIDGAIVQFQKAIELEPKKAEHRMQLSLARKRKGDLAGAKAELRIAIELAPNLTGPHERLGNILADEGDFDGARSEFQKAFAINRDDASVHNSLAWILATWPDHRRRDPVTALEHARRAIELRPRDANLYNTLGVAEYRAGHWNAAVEALTRSMDLSRGGAPSDWFFLAMSRWQQGRKDDARPLFEKAVAVAKKGPKSDAKLRRFWSEAAELLGQPGPEADAPSPKPAP